MRPGIWSQYLKEMPPEEAVKVFAEEGWTAIELSSEHSGALVDRGRCASVGQGFAAFAAGEGVAVPQGHLWLEVDVAADNQAEVIDRLKRWLDLYTAIGIRAAVIHAGGDRLKDAGADAGMILERRVRAFVALVAHLDGSDTLLCIENTPSAPRLEEILEIIEAVQSPRMAVCLDTGHANIDGVDMAGFIAKSGPLLQALHIHDNDGRSDQHLIPSDRGTIHWDEVVAALTRARYEGLFCFEIPGETDCPMPVRLAKLCALKRILPALLEGGPI